VRNFIDDPEHWWSRAEETRAIAEIHPDPEARQIMLQIAEGYDQLAQLTAEGAADSCQTRQ
jgi:hypothetical protein